MTNSTTPISPYDRVTAILDRAIGGSSATIGAHGTFWRKLSRDEFVRRKVYGLQLVVPGDGKDSALIKALRGESPFGADLPEPPDGARYARMPEGMPPVPDDEIAFIEGWIDAGCPATSHAWRPTSAPKASSRYDDVWFHSEQLGWAVNSNGQILRTSDGGDSWQEQLHDSDAYMRCVAFASPTRGWVGLVAATVPGKVLYETSDGGATWTLVANLPSDAPDAVCGIWVVDENIVYIAGTNRPEQPARMMKTLDGGRTWVAWDMRAHAHNLIDLYFRDANTGWVIGGRSDDVSDPSPSKPYLRPVVLYTTDGGATWTDQLASTRSSFPLGEWGWKIDFVDAKHGFISLQNYDAGAILVSADAGQTWSRRQINDGQKNANLEGIGFVDSLHGWVGGWGDRPKKKRTSSESFDGGQTWRDANHIGRTINRFRFLRTSSPLVGYAAGETIYKYSDAPSSVAVSAPTITGPTRLCSIPRYVEAAGTVKVRIAVPPGARRLTVKVWDPDGPMVQTLLDEVDPKPGGRTIAWSGEGHSEKRCASYSHILRVTVDDHSESRLVRVTARLAEEAVSGLSLKSVTGASSSVTSAGILRFVSDGINDIETLKESLAAAIRLEFSTIPPYLCAEWSVRDPEDPVAETIRRIVAQEMVHMGLACNMLKAIGGQPMQGDPSFVPAYPTNGLPGNVHPDLRVDLLPLSPASLEVFKVIEFPNGGPIAIKSADLFPTIGEFYDVIEDAFRRLDPPITSEGQVRSFAGGTQLFVISSVEDALRALNEIREQGEGTRVSPYSAGFDPENLAHYYAFAEMVAGRRIEQDSSGRWGFTGDAIAFPDVFSFAPGSSDTTAPFRRTFTELLRLLDAAWGGDAGNLRPAVRKMRELQQEGRRLVSSGVRPDFLWMS